MVRKNFPTFGDIMEKAIADRMDRLINKDGVTDRQKIFEDIVARFERKGVFVALLKTDITKDDFCIFINECIDKHIGGNVAINENRESQSVETK